MNFVTNVLLPPRKVLSIESKAKVHPGTGSDGPWGRPGGGEEV